MSKLARACYKRDPGYTLPLTLCWRVVCVQLVAPFAGNMDYIKSIFRFYLLLLSRLCLLDRGWSDHARHHGTNCLYAKARPAGSACTSMVMYLYIRSRSLGGEEVLWEFDLLVASDATKSCKVGV